MKGLTILAFLDELEKLGCNLPTKKLATMVKYTKPMVKKAGKPAKDANRYFGLPLDVPKRKKRNYELGNMSAAQSADRSQSPIAAQNTPDVGSQNRIDPAYGPGGV